MKRIFSVLLLGCFVAYGSAADETTTVASCDDKGINIYQELGYESSGETPCPISYKSLGTPTATANTCYYQGKTYNDGASIKNENPCNFCKCRCASENNCTVSCVKPTCTMPCAGKSSTCFNVYPKDKCCPTSCKCPPELPAQQTCVVGDNTYYEGESYRTVGTCQDCTCKTGGPSCQPTTCGIEVNYKKELEDKCAPFYYGTGPAFCCPGFFICKNDTLRMNIIDNGSSDKPVTCALGDVTYNIGAEILFAYGHPSEIVVQCKCLVPPMMFCKEF